MPPRECQIEELFHAALEHPTPARGEFLTDTCGSDSALRAEVESLLTAHTRAANFIERPAVGAFPELAVGEPADALAGRRIGAYRLLRVIASGGMGTVYEAEQDRPRRVVALKVMQGGLGTRSAVRRFQYESQILAKLRHPGIAQVFEAGVHEQEGASLPYFAMEYIPGARTLIAYAQAHGLSTADRLQLFMRVCEAVHHGHLRGVIHRDLKPSNILVAEAEATKPLSHEATKGPPGLPHPFVASSLRGSVASSAQPKIIDFGVALATDSDVTPTRTSTGELMGTLQYMSPEQCDANPDDLDARSDVYALGLVLHELLGGRPPYDVGRASIAKAARIIREQQPQRLSEIDRAFRGDLETIVLKALEKDRERRYASAAGLGSDLQRFLDNRPIEARPPSAIYQLRKLVSRHKPIFAALAMLFMSLAAFGVGMTMLYQRAELNRVRAERAEQTSRSEAKTAREVSDYLVNLFQTLDPWAGSSTEENAGALPTLELLDREALTIGEKLKDQPLTQAEVLLALAGAYRRLEMYGRCARVIEQAVELRRRCAAGDDAKLALDLEFLGDALRRKGEFAAAEVHLREALAIRRRLAESSAARRFWVTGTLQSLAALAGSQGRLDEAVTLHREAVALRAEDAGPRDANVIAARINLGVALRMAGDYAEAERVLREIIAQTTDPPALIRLQASAWVNLTPVLRDAGDDSAAEECMRQAVEVTRRWKGADALEAYSYLQVLASFRRALGDLDGAEALLREALDFYATRVAADHPTVGSMLYTLLHVLVEKGDSAGLEVIEREFAEQFRRTRALPEDHPSRSGAALHLGTLKLYRGDLAAAEPLLRECFEIRRGVLSREHWLTAYAGSVLGECLALDGRYEAAEPLLLAGWKVSRVQLGRRDDRVLLAARRLAALYDAWGRPKDAARYRNLDPPLPAG